MHLPSARPASLLLFCFAFGLHAELPPLLDRDLFFADPEISSAKLSPDGRFIAFVKPLGKIRNVWMKKTAEPFAAARPLTAQKDTSISNFLWSRDSRYVLFTRDNRGDENYNVYAVDVSASPGRDSETPGARNLTNAIGVRAEISLLPRTRPDVIYVELNDRDKAWHDLYEVNISTGQRKLIHKNTERIAIIGAKPTGEVLGWVFDWQDRLRLATRSAENGDNEILRLDGDQFTKVYTCSVLEQCSPLAFHRDGKRVYLMTNKGSDRDLVELVLFDPDTQKEEVVQRDPRGRADLANAVFSENGQELIGTMYVDDRHLQYWTDKPREADYRWLELQLPGKEFEFASHTADENLCLITAHSDVEPGETYLFDRRARTLTFQYRVYDNLAREHLASQRIVRYRSSDGLEIPAYLTEPKGIKPKNLPVVIYPHGGPWAQDWWGFNRDTQFWANRGYAVLSMNFRGSAGYGKHFIDAGNGEWGQKMQDDITAGVRYLVSQGIADPKRVGIMGASYGGYATLAGVAFTPDLYSAAVAVCAPSNLITLLASVPPYWEQLRRMFNVRLGDSNTPEGKAKLERQSPLYSAGQIKTPLMVVQGANDPRVKKSESDQIVVASRDREFPVEYLVADDEGHGFRRPVNNLALYAEAERFFARYLGGASSAKHTTGGREPLTRNYG